MPGAGRIDEAKMPRWSVPGLVFIMGALTGLLGVLVLVTTGSALASQDLDGDGVPDLADNCPSVANASQSDADSDGVGDACDNCANQPNCDQGDAGVEKILVDSGAADDLFGYAVTLSTDGGTALVGAYQDDDLGSNSGSAYVLRSRDGGWSTETKLMADDGVGGDSFGFAVSLSADGSTALVGSHENDDLGQNSGSAYIFTSNGGNWIQQAKLTASDGVAGDWFGRAVSLSADGSTALIGARAHDGAGVDSGAAYVFVLDAGAWSEEMKLVSSDGTDDDLFGTSVALSADGSTALIGASRDDNPGTDAGSAYVFTCDAGSWTEEAKLFGADTVAGDAFGDSVSLSADGTSALVGSPSDDDDGSGSGSAYLFTRDGIAWSEQLKLITGDGAAGDRFGFSVALSGDGRAVVVGSYHDDDLGSNSGSAYLFRNTGGAWTAPAKLLAPDGQFGDAFGVSVSIAGDGSLALIGAYFDGDLGTRSGSAYVLPVGCQGDDDDDGAGNSCDNCPESPNELQSDADADGSGDACDPCPDDPDNDADGDGICGDLDNCPTVSNETQTDADGDSQGDPCDSCPYDAANDSDADGFCADVDNCPATANPGQPDGDGDGAGDACDNCPSLASCEGGFAMPFEVIAADGTTGDRLGGAVAFSADGSTAIVGAPGDDTNAGSAYVFVREGDVWVQQARLISPTAHLDGFFGHAVSLSGDGSTALIGASGDDIEGAGSGAAFVFKRSGSDWINQIVLSASDAEPGDGFGFSVALSADGSTAIVGAQFASSPFDANTGVAYVFVVDEGGWSEQAKLEADSPRSGDRFGYAVALTGDGSTALVGAYNGRFSVGAAYTFRQYGGSWTQTQILNDTAPSIGGAGSVRFGAAVALSSDGSTAIVGSPFRAGGRAYIFTFSVSENIWVNRQWLLPADAADEQDFGSSVSLSADGATALIGARGDSENGPDAGAAYVFSRGADLWEERQKIHGSAGGDRFATALSVTGDGRIALVGAELDDGGSARVVPLACLSDRDADGHGNACDNCPDMGNLDQADADLDGAGDACDNCPQQANADQADADLDGIGDACDACATDPDNDADLDDHCAESDSCPLVANPTQSDGDGDGVGDVCDNCSATANCDSGTSRSFELLAVDSEAVDQLGAYVAISSDGSTAAVGAVGDDDLGTNAGAAYIFVRQGDAWIQQAKLTAGDGIAWQELGSVSLSADGSTALVGTIRSYALPGAAYVFVRNGTEWTEQAKLTASDGLPVHWFGQAVELSDDGAFAFVGARNWYGPNQLLTGAVYVFGRNGGQWSEQNRLTPAGPMRGLGSAIALSADGATLLVGASWDDGVDLQSGAALVFSGADSTWTQQARLTASDGSQFDFFGGAVALSSNGSIALVGASGAAYAFERNGAAWSEQAKLLTDHSFSTVALSADGAVGLIGASASGSASSSGAAFVFTSSKGVWEQRARLSDDSGVADDRFGGAVAMTANGRLALIGARCRGLLGPCSGSAYFVPMACQWDRDMDTTGDACDSCPDLAAADQADPDADGLGSPCDNCPHAANLDQIDLDLDGLGDACDPCPFAPDSGPGGTAPFPGVLLAASHTEDLSWTGSLPYALAIGELTTSADVGDYAVLELSTGVGDVLHDPTTPAPGTGRWYLLRPDCPNGSWSSGGSGEFAGRDATLP